MVDDSTDREAVAQIRGRGRWALALGFVCVVGALAAFNTAYNRHLEAEMLDLIEGAVGEDLRPRSYPGAPRPGERGYYAYRGRQRRGDGNLAALAGFLLLPVAGAAFVVRRSKSGGSPM